MSSLRRIAKVGEGIYGMVYKAELTTPPPLDPSTGKPSNDKSEVRIVAVKRNLRDLPVNWIGNVRELDMLARLKGSPFIVDLVTASFDNPFGRNNPMTPINEKDKQIREDKVHFVLEYVPINGEAFFIDKSKCTPFTSKILACQLLLGMELVHARSITHRDMKPANILISNRDSDGLILKICDFGMSQILSQGIPSTPGVATSWYRAPEICCHNPGYTNKSDMWSAGCIIYEMVAKAPLFYGTGDNDRDVFNMSLGKMPTRTDDSIVITLQNRGKPLTITSAATPFHRKSFVDQANMDSQYSKEYDRSPGSLRQFEDLLIGLLNIDPDHRLSATQALDHPFFNGFRDYIRGVRERYPPKPFDLPIIKITDCAERRWAIGVAFALYNHRTQLSWYKHRIIFHAIDLFDRYLNWAFNSSSIAKGSMETIHTGRLHSKVDTELRFYVCLYLMHKYFTTLVYPVEWRTFSPTIFGNQEYELIAEQFEITLIKDVSEFRLYQDTLLEMPEHYNHTLTEELVRTLLIEYGQCQGWDNASIRALYRKIMKIDSNTTST